MGLLLLILSIVLSVILLPVGWIYSLVTLRLKWSKLNAYAKNIALSIDQLGNVVLTKLGKWISKILNKIDPNHVEKASRSLD